MSRRVFITVGEASGDQHAAAFARALTARDATIAIEGFGGPKMRAAGVSLLHDSVDRAAMGWRGALRALEVWRLLGVIRPRWDEAKPDLLVCVDSFAMNYHFAKEAQRRRIPVLYFVPPQLWASRAGRIKKLRRVVNHVATILPFEEAYLRERCVNATYVGHPVLDEVREARARIAAAGGLEASLRGEPTVGIIAGSRRSEVNQNLPRLLEVARRIIGAHPGVRFLLPTTPATHGAVSRIVGAFGDAGRFTLAADAFDRLVPMCDLVLCKSGTSTLHVAAHGVPMLIVYAINPILWHAAVRFIVRTRTYGLVNLLALGLDATRSTAGHLCAEFIPWYGSTEPVAEEALALLADPSRRASQRAALLALAERLDRPGVAGRVADVAVGLM